LSPEPQKQRRKEPAKNFEKVVGAEAFASSSSDESDIPFRSGTYIGTLCTSTGRKKEDIYTRFRFELEEGAEYGTIEGSALDKLGGYAWKGEFNAETLTLRFARQREHSALHFEGKRLDSGSFSGIWLPEKASGDPGRWEFRRGKMRKGLQDAKAVKKQIGTRSFM